MQTTTRETNRTSILSAEEEKALESSISPYKLNKQLRSLIERISKKQEIILQVLPNSYSLHGSKDTYKELTSLHVLLLMLCKISALKIELSHSKMSKKYSSEENNRGPLTETIVDWKFIVFCNERLEQRKEVNEFSKRSKKHQVNFLSFQINDEPDSMNESFSMKFAALLLENLLKISSISKIAQLSIKNCFPLRQFVPIDEVRDRLILRLCSGMAKVAELHNVETLRIYFEGQNYILKQLGNSENMLQNLYTLSIKDREINEKGLFSCLKKTPSLCNLRIDAIKIGDENESFCRELIQNFIPEHNQLIECVMLPEQSLPDLDPDIFAEILWKCPFLGDIITYQKEAVSFDVPLSEKKEKVNSILKKIRNRRVTLQNCIDLLKVIDIAEDFSFETCLELLDCCEQYIL